MEKKRKTIKDDNNNVMMSFEKGIDRLELIVGQLDQNDIPLDQALACFQEGVELVRHCNSLLDSAEAKVRILSEDGRDEVVLDV